MTTPPPPPRLRGPIPDERPTAEARNGVDTARLRVLVLRGSGLLPVQIHALRKTTAPRLAVILLFLLGPGACSDTDPGTLPEVQITTADSAGVQHTTSRGPALRYAVLDTIPFRPLGTTMEGGPTSFAGVQGVLQDGSGRIWVADGQANELRLFDVDGRHLTTLGGRGEGPGEFQQLLLLGALAGDTILAGDRILPRVSAFGPDGTLAWTRTLPAGDAPPARPFALLPDGSLLAMARASLSVEGLAEGTVLRENNTLLRIAEDGTSAELGTAPGAEWVWTGSALVPLPFTTPSAFVVVADALHVVAGADARVNVFRAGHLSASYHLDEQDRAVGPGDLDAYRTFVETWIPEPMQSSYVDLLNHPERPGVLPTWDRMLEGVDGEVWIRRYAIDPLAPRDWDVFDFEGRWQGQVHVVAGFEPLQVLDAALLGVWRSELGVEEIREYGFRSPAG